MIKYLRQAGYKFKENYNDMTHKEFYMSNINYENSEISTLQNVVLDRQEVYGLFLKSLDAIAFKTTLENIINSANSDGVNATLGNSIEVINVENGYQITLNFVIQG